MKRTATLIPYILANSAQWWVFLFGLLLLASCTAPRQTSKGGAYVDPVPQSSIHAK